MDLKRRDFLRTSLAGLGTATLASETARSARAEDKQTPNPKYPFSTDPLATVQLTPEIKTSRIGFGTGMTGHQRQSNLTRMDRTKAIDMLQYAYERGVRFFDCADLYGTHDVVVTALEGKPRDSYVLSTKLWPHPGGIPEKERPDAETVVKRFLKECKTDYLDMVQIHCMMKPNWQDDMRGYMDDLAKLKEQGLIRAHGFSAHNLGSVKNGATDPWVDAIHIRLNGKGVRMDGSFEDNVAAAKLAQENGKGIVCMKLVGEGTMRDLEERKRSIDMVVRSQVVDVYIVGFEDKSQIDELIDNIGASLKGIEAEMKA